MKVLVTGGRDFDLRHAVFEVLDKVNARRPVTELIHGDARGADRLCGEWARSRGVRETVCPADWDTHGKAAGHIRNRQMCEMRPDVVVAFPGGRGTAHCVKTATDMGLRVIRAYPREQAPAKPFLRR